MKNAASSAEDFSCNDDSCYYATPLWDLLNNYFSLLYRLDSICATLKVDQYVEKMETILDVAATATSKKTEQKKEVNLIRIEE